MSVIIAKAGSSCSSNTTTTINLLPGISTQTLITALNVGTVDAVPTSSSRAVKWLVTMSTVTYSKMCCFEIYATHTNGALPHYVQYATQNDGLLYSVDATIIGSNLSLIVNNNDAEDIVVLVTRLVVPVTKMFMGGQRVTISKSTATIEPTQTQPIGSYQFENTFGAKWFVTLSDVFGNKTAFQVFSLIGAGVNPSCTVYGIIGNTKNFSVDVVSQGMLAELQITNDSGSPYSASTTMIPMQPISPTSPIPADTVSIEMPAPVVILPSTTTIVDSAITIPGYAAVKWLVCVNEPTRTMAFEMSATRSGMSTPSDVLYATISDRFDIDVNCVISGMFFELHVTNNEPTNITVTAIRIPVTF